MPGKSVVCAVKVGLLAGGLLLAGCSKEKAVDVKNATPGEVAKEAAASAPHFEPGRWETAVKFDKMEIPGMPQAAGGQQQAVAQAMAAAMQKEHIATSCLTEAEAAKPKPDFFGGTDKSCTYDHFTMGDGKIDAKLVCAGGGMDRTMTMAGMFDSTSFAMHISSEGKGPGGRAMSMQMSMKSHRVGACTGDEGKGE